MDNIASTATDSVARTKLDLWFFVATFAMGVLAYFGLHFVFHVHQLVVTVVLALLMLVYAAAVFVVPRLRVRMDQAGDNAYYLGLLFTLMSMAVALYEFSADVADEGARVDQIIGNFGIALASTVLGILLRVVLHQMRVDPADVESVSRIELSEASNRVRADLGRVSVNFSHAHDEMAQRTRDAIEKIVAECATSIERMSLQVLKLTEAMLTTTSAAQEDVLRRTTSLTSGLAEMAEEARLATERLRAVKAPAPALSKRLDEISMSVVGLNEKLSEVTSRLVVAGESSVTASSALDAAASAIVQVGGQLDLRQRDSANRLTEAVQKVTAALEQTAGALQKERALLAELEQGTRNTVQQAVEAQTAANNVLVALTESTRGLTQFIDSRRTAS